MKYKMLLCLKSFLRVKTFFLEFRQFTRKLSIFDFRPQEKCITFVFLLFRIPTHWKDWFPITADKEPLPYQQQEILQWRLRDLKNSYVSSLCHLTILAFSKLYVRYRKKKSQHKISSLKNFVTGKIIRHFLATNFFAWLSEKIYLIKKHESLTLITHYFVKF